MKYKVCLNSKQTISKVSNTDKVTNTSCTKCPLGQLALSTRTTRTPMNHLVFLRTPMKYFYVKAPQTFKFHPKLRSNINDKALICPNLVGGSIYLLINS